MTSVLALLITVFPSEKWMREGMKKVSAQTSLLVYFVRNAQRRPFDPFFLRRKPSYPLWRDVADPAFLQQAGVEEAAAGLRSTVAAAFAISPLGADPGAALRHHHGAAAHQQDRHPAVQRCLLGDARPEA